MARELGAVQKSVLRSIGEFGQWSVKSGWLWDTQTRTDRVCQSLVKRGLLSTTVKDGTTFYGLTKAGKKEVARVVVDELITRSR